MERKTGFKRERKISLIVAVLLLAYYLFMTWFVRSGKADDFHHTIGIPMAIGWQLIYGIGIAIIFARSSYKVLLIVFLLQGILLYATGKFTEIFHQGLYLTTYNDWLLPLLYWAPGLALFFLAIVGVIRLIFDGIKFGFRSIRR